jgi:tetratricopeptide (TPR) repeat protein
MNSTFGSSLDLDKYITDLRRSVKHIPKNDSHGAEEWNKLGRALHTRFEHSNSTQLTDLHNAIAAWQSAVDRDSAVAVYYRDLSLGLRTRFDRAGSISDLHKAVDMATKATELLEPLDQAEQAIIWNVYGGILRRRGEQIGSRDDLDKSIAAFETAISLSAENNFLHNLGNALQTRFDITGQMEDLNNAINQYRAVDSDDPFEGAAYASSLGTALGKRYDLLRNGKDLEESIAENEKAVKLTPEDHPDRPMYLNELGLSLQRRFELDGDIDALEDAVAHAESATFCSIRDPDRPMFLNNFGIALQILFERFGQLKDLNYSIKQMLEASSAEGADRPKFLNNLGSTLRRRFEQTGSMTDLNESIRSLRDALKLAKNEHDRAIILNNLSISLHVRFEIVKDDGLREAIKYSEEAVSLSERWDIMSNRPAFLNDLANLLEKEFDTSDNPSVSSLERAVNLKNAAVDSTAKHNPLRASYLNSLGIAMEKLYRHNNDAELLTKSIQMRQESVNLTPPEDQSRAKRLYNLAVGISVRAERMQQWNDLYKSIEICEEAVSLTQCSPVVRILAASFATRLAYNYLHDVDIARKMLVKAVELFPLLSPRILTRSDQQRALSEFSGLPGRCASLILDTNDTFEALRLLEIGRGVMASLYLDTRTDLTDLETYHPRLARRFRQLRDELDVPETDANDPGMNSNRALIVGQSERRHSASQQLNTVIQQIRSLKGYQNFLRGPSLQDIHALAVPGPIVVINVSEYGSHAIIITKERMKTIKFRNFENGQVREQALSLLQIVQDDNPVARRHLKLKLSEILRWLWESAIEEVINALPSPSNSVPQVWWMPVGVMTLFPIHAAGDNRLGKLNNVLDRCVSSYVSTLRALDHSRRQLERPFGRDRRPVTRSVSALPHPPEILLVSMSETPENSNLDSINEIRIVENNIPRSMRRKVLKTPTKEQVLEHLRDLKVVHLSCHSEVDPDPSKSRVLLTDWKTNPLTVADIVGLKIDHAKLAYLSSCHAATSIDHKLHDEGIHLAGAFQLAGFPCVVASLWHVGDNCSPVVSGKVYGSIQESEMDVRVAAYGVHKAQKEIRDQTRSRPRANGQDDPLEWAPFIYVGA